MENSPLIVAEMSANHNQSLDRALAIVDAAAKAGAHAVKLQTYTPDTMTLPGVFTIEDENSLWQGMDLYELYQKAHTPWEWHKPLFDRARELGIMAFSTPFDATAVEFLEELGNPIYKVASFENTDIPLMGTIARTGKPVILSTGGADLAQISRAVTTLKENGCTDLTLLKCTSAYPAPVSSCNLLTLPHMAEMFDCKVGLSDHTQGMGAALAAVALGARVIEKHFTLDRADGGVDAPFSMEPSELAQLVAEADRAHRALGGIQYQVQASETETVSFKRSLYISRDVAAGEMLTPANVRVIRPGLGLSPRHYDTVLGRAVKSPLKEGTPLAWAHLA